MKRIQFSIPFSVELAEEKSWEALNKKKTSFGVVRCHFQLNERVLDEPHQVGDALAVYKSPKGVGSQHVISSSFELEEIKQVSSIKNFLIEHESTSKFASEIAAKMGFSKKNELSAKAKFELSDKLKTSMTSINELHDSQKIRETTSFEITNTIDPSITAPIVAVPVYKRKAYDLLLGYVDFLQVDYKRAPFSLRKKAMKYPAIVDYANHPNRIKFGVPLSTIMYWEFLPKSSALMLESEHSIQVDDAEEINISNPQCEKIKYVKFPDVPSLYQISNAAFPFKWVMRKSKKREWTEGELKKIELEEVKNLKNGWWQQNGK